MKDGSFARPLSSLSETNIGNTVQPAGGRGLSLATDSSLKIPGKFSVSDTMGIGTDAGGTAFTIVNSTDRQMILLQGVASQTGYYIKATDASNNTLFAVSNIGEVYSPKANASDLSFISHVYGDSEIRGGIEADGAIFWGNGSAAPDVRLYRQSANKLHLDDDFQIEGGIYLTGVFDTPAVFFGSSSDVVIFRNATASPTLRTDTPFTLGNYTTAGRPAAGNVRAGSTIYVSDAAAGSKLQYSDGAAWVAAG